MANRLDNLGLSRPVRDFLADRFPANLYDLRSRGHPVAPMA